MIEYMMCYKLMSLIVALMVATISWGQIWMEPLHTTGKTSFAIVADLTTWQKCQAEILRYRDVLEAEQLPSYIVADRWNCLLYTSDRGCFYRRYSDTHDS